MLDILGKAHWKRDAPEVLEDTVGPLDYADVTFGFGSNVAILGPDEDITHVRQWHRNVFAERCRLAGIRPPDATTMLIWWPGTRAVFA